jgi:exodeoxyribonuclease VII small subunit
MTKDNKNINFSEKMKQLEKIATELEDSEIDLDEAIDKFEKGAKLAEELKEYLLKSKNRIKTIKKTFDKPS